MKGRLRLYAAVVVSTVTFAVAAVELRSGSEAHVATDEVVEGDLYITGQSVVVDGRVTGDLVAAGRSIVVRGTVDGDLIAAGQTVEVEGEVGDDARIAGMALRVAPGARIADHLIAAGYSLEMDRDSQLGGDLIFSGYQALLAGSAGGDVTVASAGLEIRGAVEGDVEAEVASEEAQPPAFMSFFGSPMPMPVVVPGLTVGEQAFVGGDLSYTSASEGVIAEGAQVAGSTRRDVPEEIEPAVATAGSRIGAVVRRLVTLLLLAVLLLGVAREPAARMVAMLREAPGRTLAFGLGASVGLPVVALTLLLVTIVLAGLAGAASLEGLAALFALSGVLVEAALAMVTWLAASFVGPLLVAWFLGVWILTRAGRDTGDFLAVLLGVVLLAALLALPVLGFAVGVLLALAGLGTITRSAFGALGWRVATGSGA